MRRRLSREPLPALAASFGAVPVRSGEPIPARQLGWAIDRTLRIGSRRPRCIFNALVLYRLLREQGDPAVLVVGLPRRRDQQGRARVGGAGRHGRRAAAGPGRARADGEVHVRPPDLFELLRRCTIEHDWTAAPDGIEAMLAGADPRTVGRAAAEHGVANLLYLSARELPTLDPELRSLLATVYHLNLTHHMKVIGELTSLAATLDAAGVPFMVVKGPVLAEVIYPRNDMRSYGDLDLVIDRRVFGDAVTALLESGCDMLDRNWRVIRREMRGQVHMAARFGTSADVHWHLINRASVRGSFAIDMDELFARARRVSLDGPDVLTLDPADTLLQLAVHAGLSGGAKLAWLKDIERAAADPASGLGAAGGARPRMAGGRSGGRQLPAKRAAPRSADPAAGDRRAFGQPRLAADRARQRAAVAARSPAQPALAFAHGGARDPARAGRQHHRAAGAPRRRREGACRTPAGPPPRDPGIGR